MHCPPGEVALERTISLHPNLAPEIGIDDQLFQGGSQFGRRTPLHQHPAATGKISGTPPPRVETTGSPLAIASTFTSPNGSSHTEGEQKMSARRNSSAS